jgi:hypothetical protein
MDPDVHTHRDAVGAEGVGPEADRARGLDAGARRGRFRLAEVGGEKQR